MEIRHARPDDVPGIVDVHIRTWQVAYLEQLPSEVLAAQEGRRPERTEMWSNTIRNASSDRRQILVAEEDGRVLGFASAGPARDEGESVGEVYAIYLDPDAWGRGIGRRLFAEVSDWLATVGYREAILWVLGSNTRARRFYEAAGWTPDGATKTETMFGAKVDEVRYRVALA